MSPKRKAFGISERRQSTILIEIGMNKNQELGANGRRIEPGWQKLETRRQNPKPGRCIPESYRSL